MHIDPAPTRTTRNPAATVAPPHGIASHAGDHFTRSRSNVSGGRDSKVVRCLVEALLPPPEADIRKETRIGEDAWFLIRDRFNLNNDPYNVGQIKRALACAETCVDTISEPDELVLAMAYLYCDLAERSHEDRSLFSCRAIDLARTMVSCDGEFDNPERLSFVQVVYRALLSNKRTVRAANPGANIEMDLEIYYELVRHCYHVLILEVCSDKFSRMLQDVLELADTPESRKTFVKAIADARKDERDAAA